MSDALVVTLGRDKRTISPDPDGTHVLMTMERFADIMDELEEAASEIEQLQKKLDAVECDLEERAEGDRIRPSVTLSWYCRNCGKRNRWSEYWCQHCEDSDE